MSNQPDPDFPDYRMPEDVGSMTVVVSARESITITRRSDGVKAQILHDGYIYDTIFTGPDDDDEEEDEEDMPDGAAAEADLMEAHLGRLADISEDDDGAGYCYGEDE